MIVNKMTVVIIANVMTIKEINVDEMTVDEMTIN